ncbi:MAG: imidazolonepropionase-like amidohydrolase [Planctomycetota bacterium]|jgi:imidazolonepropionase-like amidohydrolase
MHGMYQRQNSSSSTASTLCASLALALSFLASPQFAQAPQRGPRHVDPRWHALTHATLIPAPGERIEDATIVVRDGLILSVSSGAAAPEGARVWDCSGLFIYAGLIEPYFEVEAPEPDEAGAHWNAMVMPQRSALDGAGISKSERESLRALGFTAACLSPKGGILRGTSELVGLGESETTTAAASVSRLGSEIYQTFSFETARGEWKRGGPSISGDPSSEMGAIALLRQTFSDAMWYQQSQSTYRISPESSEPVEVRDALAALGTGSSGTRLLFDSRTELQLLRASRLAKEFGRSLMVLGSGAEYRRLDAVLESQLAVIVPLNFPMTPEVATLAQAERVSLRTLMSWEQAPANPRRLVDAGIKTVLTSAKLKKSGKNFWPNLRKAIEYGLSEEDALAMLTTQTASLLGVGGDGGLGRVATGYLAHLTITDGELFAEDTKIRDVWVGGRRYEVNSAPAIERDGDWSGTLALATVHELSLSIAKKKLTLNLGETKIATRELNNDGEQISFLFEGDELSAIGTWSFAGSFESDQLFGTFVDPSGQLIAGNFSLAPSESTDEDAEEDEDEDEAIDDPLADLPETWPTPFGAFGFDELPAQESLLFTNTTVWTSADAGRLENAAVWISGGRIQFVGKASDVPDVAGARVIDLNGAHLTPGMIDCHSHTGISGAVNEMGQRVTSEVRVSDVIDPDDINWYRQLAGGMTAANQLHGSGNAVGGQNSVVKNRWGAPHPDGMRFGGAIPGIKFALGENPKRVASNTHISDEYPNTRMGVAALIRDRLLAGREYRMRMDQYEALASDSRSRTMPPRRDLELEALGEIMANERLIHCHSYRQDEILMLCRTAQEFGFKIGTFQHVLEGYKVAEAIKEAALGASTFSDWWAYKFEVIDAIPFNASIMHDVGVVTSINSDSADHARRLNTEAAKSVKYGGMSETDALKMVTLNPAIQLGVEARVGSIEVGKDADIAIWSGSPLSYKSRCERTYVDGRELFSIDRDTEQRTIAQSERQRIIQKIHSASRPDKKDESDEDESEGGEDETYFEEYEALLRSGLPGDCGCNHQNLQSLR